MAERTGKEAGVRAIAVKEFRELRRDRRTLAMLFLLPFLFLVVFGYAASFDIKDVPTVVVGSAAQPWSHGSCPAPSPSWARPQDGDAAAAREQLRRGEAVVAVVTPAAGGGAPRSSSTAPSSSPRRRRCAASQSCRANAAAASGGAEPARRRRHAPPSRSTCSTTRTCAPR